jgi:hypothetical protein
MVAPSPSLALFVPPAGTRRESGTNPAQRTGALDFREQLRSLTERSQAAQLTRAVRKGVSERDQFSSRLASRPDTGLASDGAASARAHSAYDVGKDPWRIDDATDPPRKGTTPASEDTAFQPEGCVEPMVRVMSNLMLLNHPVAVQTSAPSAMLERIALQLVRKVALGTSSVHLEFGDGVLADGKLTVHCTSDGLEIAVQAPAGMDPSQLCTALTRRLERKGIKLASLEVT